jgi:hypothetical protein
MSEQWLDKKAAPHVILDPQDDAKLKALVQQKDHARLELESIEEELDDAVREIVFAEGSRGGWSEDYDKMAARFQEVMDHYMGNA